MNVSPRDSEGQKDKYVNNIKDEETVTVDGLSCIDVGINVETYQYDLEYSLTQSISNFYGVNYKNKCNGHYYWFVAVQSLD